MPALVAVIATAAPNAVPTAAAEPPCRQELLTDWRDGAISGSYPVSCYRETLRRLPEDVRLYSSAADDIARALAQRLGPTRRAAGAALEPAAPATSAGGRLPTAPLALAGSLAALSLVAAAALAVWLRRVRR